MDFHLFRIQPHIRITCSVVSDVGRFRKNNEDNFLLNRLLNANSADHQEFHVRLPHTGWQLAAVFDGMGGGELGEVASLESAQVFAKTALFSAYTPREMAEKSVRNAFQAANNRIVLLQSHHKVYGTTGTVLLTDGNVFKIFHMGDSRAYRFRDGRLRQLTPDHTLAQVKLDAGISPVREADRHTLTNYIGYDSTMENVTLAETPWASLRRGDQLLLCTDGLYDQCTEDHITAILRTHKKAEAKTAALLHHALENGGSDNITCLLLRFS